MTHLELYNFGLLRLVVSLSPLLVSHNSSGRTLLYFGQRFAVKHILAFE
jgi:hypothetical protein